jgi:hypothetical protein
MVLQMDPSETSMFEQCEQSLKSVMTNAKPWPSFISCWYQYGVEAPKTQLQYNRTVTHEDYFPQKIVLGWRLAQGNIKLAKCL